MSTNSDQNRANKYSTADETENPSEFHSIKKYDSIKLKKPSQSKAIKISEAPLQMQHSNKKLMKKPSKSKMTSKSKMPSKSPTLASPISLTKSGVLNDDMELNHDNFNHVKVTSKKLLEYKSLIESNQREYLRSQFGYESINSPSKHLSKYNPIISQKSDNKISNKSTSFDATLAGYSIISNGLEHERRASMFDISAKELLPFKSFDNSHYISTKASNLNNLSNSLYFLSPTNRNFFFSTLIQSYTV